jgi:hypothetical protein
MVFTNRRNVICVRLEPFRENSTKASRNASQYLQAIEVVRQSNKKFVSRSFAVAAAAVAASAGIAVSWCDNVRSEGSSSDQTRASHGRDPIVDLFAELETGAQFPKTFNPPVLTDDKGWLRIQLHFTKISFDPNPTNPNNRYLTSYISLPLKHRASPPLPSSFSICFGNSVPTPLPLRSSPRPRQDLPLRSTSWASACAV